VVRYRRHLISSPNLDRPRSLFLRHATLHYVVFATPDRAVALVYECAHTDLEKILKDRAIPISLADIKQHIKTLLVAVEACHLRWILHRDLKPDNMLFLKDGTMKLADFGLARMHGTPKTRLSPEAITLWYKPPELLMVRGERRGCMPSAWEKR
jgi:cyclin-dependent kinase 7